MAWILLVVAGIFEIIWASAMKRSEGFTKLGPSAITLGAMIISFGLLAAAMRQLPLGTAYMIWTGIGAIGAFIYGVVALNEPANAMRIGAAALIVTGIAVMKFATPAS
ncbi:QacE family quaternary ammonium compound efflux SMR transporter [Pseudonocardia sp. TMWB2A]|uniref:DMT family transporter n=1 Tax=Pseudonocardia sp. TMWB2A TaxID=687430 RepID=UPI00307ED072